MRIRKLRIAWTVAWGVVAVLLCVLWVRSYLVYDQVVVYWPKGLVWFFAYSNKGMYIISTYGLLAPQIHAGWWFFGRNRWGTAVYLPYSLTMFAVCAVAFAPWIHYRFSVRALLIATTLVAVVLGLIVWKFH
jgi:hypothetical protein